MPKDDLATSATDVAGSTPSDSDRVGYRQPPKHSRFQPGQSENPRGRLKARPSFQSDFASKLLTTISSGDATKWEAMCERLANAGVANTGVALKLVPLVIAMFKAITARLPPSKQPLSKTSKRGRSYQPRTRTRNS